MSQMISVNNVTVKLADKIVLNQININFQNQKLNMILGPNGCGKSTLLKVLTRNVIPNMGEVHVGKQKLSNVPLKDFARMLGYLPQSPGAPNGLTVYDLVARGRSPHQSFFSQWSDKDDQAVENALRATHILEYHDHLLSELSGGQRQRAWIAMILAQETDIILLDEPTSALDIRHEIEILLLLRELVDKHHKTIVVVIHDLNIAARFADHIIAMKNGHIIKAGNSEEVLQADILEKIYDWPCDVVNQNGVKMIAPSMGLNADKTAH